MLLAIDIGNSNISVGLFNGEKKLEFLAALDTDSKRTADQISVDLLNLFALYHHDIREVTGAIFCSVVPPMNFMMVSALEKYPTPIVTIDMGTATTIGVISEGRNYEGGLLLPGVNVSLDALSRRAAQLPDISLQHPKALIGKNTEDCMRSGIVYGTASMLDGLLDRIRETFPDRELTAVATGGNAPVILRYCRNRIIYDKYLLMEGLWAIYQRNR